MPVEAEAEARGARQSEADTISTQGPPLRELFMEVDGRVDDEEDDAFDTVYTGDLQVEETSASIEAGSPIPTQQRRQLRSHTMRLGRRPSSFTYTHARGYSDTTGASTMGRSGADMTPRTRFTSINAPRSGYNEPTVGVETRGVDNEDRMFLD
ncbi:hypothetical protein FHL15_004025 [Xylaria flabelliformis]|uniref:Uncharacterized protein n=1 Tax=Xylaria flabelliformis TaxID=2512241 RepID=A0A553I411_9PEZI|nr:hypothetical protein FHL15_004025 [Xylaria flabelliformis]